MNFLALSALLLASAPAALGQNTTIEGLFQALTSAGHTQLVSAAQQLNGTGAGQSILSQLSNGSPSVLFAPTDNACKLPRQRYPSWLRIDAFPRSQPSRQYLVRP